MFCCVPCQMPWAQSHMKLVHQAANHLSKQGLEAFDGQIGTVLCMGAMNMPRANDPTLLSPRMMYMMLPPS